MRRTVFIAAVLALAGAAALVYGGCKATDVGSGVSAQAPQPGEKLNANAPTGTTPTGTTPTGTTVVNADGVRRVTVAELQAMLKEGSAAIYDTRAKPSYDAEHIQGSLSMPFDEVEKRSGELPKNKTLVFYCT